MLTIFCQISIFAQYIGDDLEFEANPKQYSLRYSVGVFKSSEWFRPNRVVEYLPIPQCLINTLPVQLRQAKVIELFHKRPLCALHMPIQFR